MPKNSKQYMQKYRANKRAAPAAQRIEAEMERQYRSAKARLEKALKTCLPGSSAYLRYAQAITDLEESHRRERAERGLDPTQLGVGVKPGWHFVCRVGVSGNVSTVEVPADRVQSELAARAKADADHIAKMTQPGDDEIRAQLDREFGFAPGAEKEENQ